ncbi:MAG: type I methionyl aminopeptidase [Deltaproteobacteria bacterium]|nr:MAG: type I methionyl aminopeptidase [Deltaproteobacteria bacterium]
MSIALRKPSEINTIAKANTIVAKTLELAKREIKPGMTSLELDEQIEDLIRSNGAKPAFKGLYGFPNATCISVNEVIIHGIPNNRRFREGDIVGVDVGVELDGWFGDGAATFAVGKASAEDEKLMNASKDALELSVAQIKEGMRFKELSAIIEDLITQRGYVPLKDFCGHGIGRKPHEEPSILNYVVGKSNQGPKIKNGMVFCIEPMLCQKSGEPQILEDGWSVVSKDGLNTSHHEYAVAVVDGKARILTQVDN